MILVDPDLKPDLEADPARGAAWVRRSTPPARAQFLNLRLPSTRTLSRFLAEAQATVRLRGEVTVLLTTDAVLRRLNRRFRNISQATDVLSFPAGTPIAGAEKIAGDLAISVETAQRQAAEQGHSLIVEVKVLILHGLLHLAGYDHETDAGRMARRERLLRERLGLPLGLIERASRREAEKIASDGVRRGTRRTQSGESRAKSRKPRRGGGNPSGRPTRSRRP